MAKTKFKSAEAKKKALALQVEWEQIIAKHAKSPFGTNGTKAKVINKPPTLEVPRRINAKSLVTPGASTASVEAKVYTGDKMLGIAQMHKSNAVPVFRAEDAVSISAMRR